MKAISETKYEVPTRLQNGMLECVSKQHPNERVVLDEDVKYIKRDGTCLVFKRGTDTECSVEESSSLFQF